MVKKKKKLSGCHVETFFLLLSLLYIKATHCEEVQYKVRPDSFSCVFLTN